MSTSAKQFLADASQYAGKGGAKPDSDQALRYLNKARQLLWNQGNWRGTMATGFVHLNDGCFYLAHPAHIIKAAYRGCSTNPISISNGEFLWTNTTSLGSVTQSVSKLPFFETGHRYPLLTSFPSGTQFGVAALNADDAGKQVTVVYEDSSCGRVVETLTLEDNWKCVYQEKGVVLRIISITKDQTLGKVQILSKHSNGTVSTIHTLSGEERDPLYTQYQVTACEENGCVVVRVKKKYLPIRDFGEPIDLDEIAIEWAMKAIVAKELDDDNKYAQALKFAREHLELEKEDFTNSISASKPVVMGSMVASSPLQYDGI